MRTVKTVTWAGAVTVLAASAVLAAPAAAQADPYNCTAYRYSAHQTAARCTGGTGTYRAVAECIGLDAVARARAVYGPTVRIGGTSIATCRVSEAATRPSLQIMSI
jgi:hypothetical protein